MCSTPFGTRSSSPTCEKSYILVPPEISSILLDAFIYLIENENYCFEFFVLSFYNDYTFRAVIVYVT